MNKIDRVWRKATSPAAAKSMQDRKAPGFAPARRDCMTCRRVRAFVGRLFAATRR
jgi:hypothetical protein